MTYEKVVGILSIKQAQQSRLQKRPFRRRCKRDPGIIAFPSFTPECEIYALDQMSCPRPLHSLESLHSISPCKVRTLLPLGGWGALGWVCIPYFAFLPLLGFQHCKQELLDRLLREDPGLEIVASWSRTHIFSVNFPQAYVHIQIRLLFKAMK